MEAKPFSMIPAIASRTYLGVNTYGNSSLVVDDINSHEAGMNTFVPLYYPLDGTYKQNGIGLNGSTDLTIGTDIGRRKITPIGGIGTLVCQYQYPVLFYKGEHIPTDDMDSANTSTGVVLLTVAKTTSKYTSTNPDDYDGYYMDYLPAIITAVDIPNISMPIESSGYGGLGVEGNVYTTFGRGDATDATGSISFQMSQTAWGPKGAVGQNQAGAEVLKRVYKGDFTLDTAWDDRQKLLNAFSADAEGAYIMILEHSGKSLTSAQGHVWGKVTTIPSLIITAISAPDTIDATSADPIRMTMDFTVRFPSLISQNTILTTGP